VSVRHAPSGLAAAAQQTLDSAAGAGAGGVDGLTSAASKAALRRAAKREREAQWAVFNANRPDDRFEALEDVAALREAAASIGDLRLRGAADFVPDKVRL